MAPEVLLKGLRKDRNPRKGLLKGAIFRRLHRNPREGLLKGAIFRNLRRIPGKGLRKWANYLLKCSHHGANVFSYFTHFQLFCRKIKPTPTTDLCQKTRLNTPLLQARRFAKNFFS